MRAWERLVYDRAVARFGPQQQDAEGFRTDACNPATNGAENRIDILNSDASAGFGAGEVRQHLANHAGNFYFQFDPWANRP